LEKASSDGAAGQFVLKHWTDDLNSPITFAEISCTIIETMKARATLESVGDNLRPIWMQEWNSRKHMPKLTVIKTPVPWIFTI